MPSNPQSPPLPISCPHCARPFRNRMGFAKHVATHGVSTPPIDPSLHTYHAADRKEAALQKSEAAINRDLAGRLPTAEKAAELSAKTEALGSAEPTNPPKASRSPESAGDRPPLPPEPPPEDHNPFNLQKENVAERRVRMWQERRHGGV